MSIPSTVYRILIASPSDVADERRLACEMIYSWNAAFALEKQTVFLPVMWETHSSPRMGDRPQAIINSQLVDNCDALIGIFWTRIGTPTGEAESGTAEEIRRFMRAEKPTMIYFSSRRVAPDDLDRAQWSGLLTFRKECESNGIVGRFESPDEFQEKLSRHLVLLASELAGITAPPINPGLGGKQGMVYQMVTQNEAGWDFIRAH